MFSGDISNTLTPPSRRNDILPFPDVDNILFFWNYDNGNQKKVRMRVKNSAGMGMRGNVTFLSFKAKLVFIGEY